MSGGRFLGHRPMSKHKHPVYGDVPVVSERALERARPQLASFQRRWDIESYARYQQGMIGGLVALEPRIITFIRRRRTIEQRTLLVSSFTSGSDLWMPSVDDLRADLANIGLEAMYDDTMLQDAPHDQLVENAHAEARRLSQRLGLPS